MEWLIKIFEIMDAQMATPMPYGAFHLFFFGLSVALGIILCVFCKKPSEHFMRRLLFWVSLLVIILEVYKQINYSFSYSDGISFDYQWYAFPFQFCSTPMYIGLLAALVKKKKLHDAFCAYLGTFSLFAGLCVMFYPVDIYIGTIGINIQTSICHGAMITLGIYLLGSGYIEPKHKTILKAISVFAILVGTAAVLNEIAYLIGITQTETFNMFFISPHCEPSLPVYSLVQAVVPFPLCLILYILAFSFAAYVLLCIPMFIKFLKKRKAPTEQQRKEIKEEITV